MEYSSLNHEFLAVQGAADIAKVEKAKPNANRMEDSLTRVFFAPESELAINEQINHEYTMSYVYHQMVSLLLSSDVHPACTRS